MLPPFFIHVAAGVAESVRNAALKALLAADCSRLDLYIQKFSFCQEKVGNGVLGLPKHSGGRCHGTVPRVDGVDRHGKEVASGGNVQDAVHGVPGEAVSQPGAGAEQ